MSEREEELRHLYRETLLHHGRRPSNFGPLEPPRRSAEGFNPLCGDRLTVHLRVGGGGRIEAARFEGTGCAISMAAASILTGEAPGLSGAEFESLFAEFRALVGGPPGGPTPPAPGGRDSLEVFAGVREFPMRVKCATLAWHAMRAALRGESEATSED